MDQEGSNSCKKINGVDTCVCGKSHECDPHKKNKLCLDGQGKKRKDDLKAKCRPGKGDLNFFNKFYVGYANFFNFFLNPTCINF